MTDQTRPPDDGRDPRHETSREAHKAHEAREAESHQPGPPPRDDLDHMLRRWHTENHDRAAAARTALLSRLSDGPASSDVHTKSRVADDRRAETDDSAADRRLIALFLILRRIAMHPTTHIAASLIVLVTIAGLLLPLGESSRVAASDEGVMLVPEGGRLDAHDEKGDLIGPCPLEHTDVNVEISGHFTRVNVTQRYANPYDEKIEAVYTFPLSHRAAVDRMTMTVGDRVVEGEVKQREVARQMYESARQQGYVASLLEQERPNIFTQSVANIEPNAEVVIKISYVEVLESTDGEYSFDFPMVVAPRYTPGVPTGVSEDDLPAGVEPRPGVVLRGPATITCPGGGCEGLTDQWIRRHAMPLDRSAQIINAEQRQREDPMRTFNVEYADGSAEPAVIFSDGVGHVGGRWFFCPPRVLPEPGAPFSPPTDQVPDADRVTPTPVKPDERAGHDIAVTVSIDTGGPGITEINSHSHDITRDDVETSRRDGRPQRTTVTLAGGEAIPNRDFRLNWQLTSDSIEEAIFTHTGDYGDDAHGFFTLILQPPDRVDDADVRPRELIFVLDNSGSMRGFPINSAKKVISRAVDTMRPDDRFNIISFNNTVDELWSRPQPNTEQNRSRAQQYVEERQGGGGTEMRSAVFRALNADRFADRGDDRQPQTLTARQLANLPADGRSVTVRAPLGDVHVDGDRHTLRVDDDLTINLDLRDDLPTVLQPEGVDVTLAGEWTTRDGRRVLIVQSAQQADGEADVAPMRIVLFVTDGLVSNDAAIIEAVREHSHETRMFTIGMGQSPNRHVLDEMARAGRGASDYAVPDQDVDPIVDRFAGRIATPVLTDIDLTFSENLSVTDVLPSPGHMPDLYDVQPLVIHGRYTEPADGTLTIRGTTGAGPYSREIDLSLPEVEPMHDTIATLWAREKVSEHMREGEVEPIVALGERFSIMTNYTSFVAIEKRRVTIDGEPRLVRVPIEFPKDMAWEGIFGDLNSKDEEIIDRIPEDGGQAALQRARELQANDEHGRALKIVESVLEVNPENAAAVALQDILETTIMYNQARGRRAQRSMDSRNRDELHPMIAPPGTASSPPPAREAEPSPMQAQPDRRSTSGGGGGFGGGGGAGGGIGGVGGNDASSPGQRRMREHAAQSGQNVLRSRLGAAIVELERDGARNAAIITIRAIDGVDIEQRLEALFADESARPLGHVLDAPRRGLARFAVVEPLRETIEPFVETLRDRDASADQRRDAFEAMVEAIDARLPQLARELELRRLLSEDLYDLVTGDADDSQTVEITVLLRDVGQETIDAVKQRGLAVIDVAADHRFIVGRADLGDMLSIAEHDAVRRIELVR